MSERIEGWGTFGTPDTLRKTEGGYLLYREFLAGPGIEQREVEDDVYPASFLPSDEWEVMVIVRQRVKRP